MLLTACTVRFLNFSLVLTHYTLSEFIVRPSLFCRFILRFYRTFDFMNTYLFFDLLTVKNVLRTFPDKFSLACANRRTILSTMAVIRHYVFLL